MPANSDLYATFVTHCGLGLIFFGGLIGKTVQTVFNAIDQWIAAGAAALVVQLARAIDTSTASPLGAGFHLVLPEMTRLAAVLSVPLLVLAMIQAIIRQDLGILGRTLLVRLPLAVCGTAAAIAVVTLGLQATDVMSRAVLATSGGPARSFLSNFATSLSVPPAGGPVLTGFAGVLLGGLAALLAFVLWLELVLRDAAVAVAALFLPLVLAALIWPATSHWARRLAETIAALVLAKLVIAAVLALAAATLVTAKGPTEIVEGIALFLLAAGSPFSLLRLVPAVEQGMIGHLEGLSRRAARTGGQTAGSVGTLLGSGDALPQSPDPIPFHPGSVAEEGEFERHFAEVSEEMAASHRFAPSRPPDLPQPGQRSSQSSPPGDPDLGNGEDSRDGGQ